MHDMRIPDYDGTIYPPEGGRVAGWLADLNALDRAVECEILVDGRSLGIFRADQSRPSLRRRGLGHGRYGFEVMVTDRPLRPDSRIAVRPLTETLPVLQRNGQGNLAPAPAPAPSEGSAETVERIISLVAKLEEDDIVRLVGKLTQGLMRNRARDLFRTQQWPEMSRFADTVLSAGILDPTLLCLLGRGALYERNFATARICLALAGTVDPASAEILFYRGVTELRDRQFDPALLFLREAVEANPAEPRMLAELCTAFRFKLTRQAGDASLIAETAAHCHKLLEMDTSLRSVSAAGQALLQAGMPADALQAVEAALPAHPDSVELLHIKSRALVSLNRVAEALEVADQVLRIAPHNQTANFQKRTLGDLAASGGERRLPVFGRLALPPQGGTDEGDGLRDLANALAQRNEDWLILDAPKAEPGLVPTAKPKTWLKTWSNLGSKRRSEGDGGMQNPLAGLDPVMLDQLVDPFVGHQVVDTGEGPINLWRRSVLMNLLDAGLVGPALEGLDRFRALYGTATPAPHPRRAILMSNYGAYKFGGGEQFLESMALHYRTRGYEPILVGYVQQFRGESGVTPAGFRYVFIEKSRSALLRLLVEEEVSLIHAVSGTGFIAAETTDHTNIRLIYGIHYWREFLGAEGDERYFDSDGAPIPRPEFRYILSRASSVYANSDFTRQLLEQTFGVRAPVVYSVPADHGKEGQP